MTESSACRPSFTFSTSVAETSASTAKRPVVASWIAPLVDELEPAAPVPAPPIWPAEPPVAPPDPLADPFADPTRSPTSRSTAVTVPAKGARRTASSTSSCACSASASAAASCERSAATRVESASDSRASESASLAAVTAELAAVRAASRWVGSTFASVAPFFTESPASTSTFVTVPETSNERSCDFFARSVPEAVTVSEKVVVPTSSVSDRACAGSSSRSTHHVPRLADATAATAAAVMIRPRLVLGPGIRTTHSSSS